MIQTEFYDDFEVTWRLSSDKLAFVVHAGSLDITLIECFTEKYQSIKLVSKQIQLGLKFCTETSLITATKPMLR